MSDGGLDFELYSWEFPICFSKVYCAYGGTGIVGGIRDGSWGHIIL